MTASLPTREENRRLVALGFGIGLVTVVLAGYLASTLIGARPVVRGLRVTPRVFSFMDAAGEPIPASDKRLAEIAGYPITPAGHAVPDVGEWVAATMIPSPDPAAAPRSALLICDPAAAGSCVVHVLDEDTVVLQRYPLPLPAPDAPPATIVWRPVGVSATDTGTLELTVVLVDPEGARYHLGRLRLDGREWVVLESRFGDGSIVPGSAVPGGLSPRP